MRSKASPALEKEGILPAGSPMKGCVCVCVVCYVCCVCVCAHASLCNVHLGQRARWPHFPAWGEPSPHSDLGLASVMELAGIP